jgi:hypothetical protein
VLDRRELDEVVIVSRAFARYVELLDQLLWRRAVHGSLSDDEEERFAVSLNDCRAALTGDEEVRLEAVIRERRAAAQKPPLKLVDVDPPPTTDGPLRTQAA